MDLTIKLAKARSRSLRVWRAVNPQSLLVACTILAVLAMQLVVPLVANTSCGLIIPHEHILVTDGASLT
jgi:hypothetical protein